MPGLTCWDRGTLPCLHPSFAKACRGTSLVRGPGEVGDFLRAKQPSNQFFTRFRHAVGVGGRTTVAFTRVSRA